LSDLNRFNMIYMFYFNCSWYFSADVPLDNEHITLTDCGKYSYISIIDQTRFMYQPFYITVNGLKLFYGYESV